MPHTTAIRFAELQDLLPKAVFAAEGLGFSDPTPVQVLAMPAILRGGDVLVNAQTGSGKTVAFALPVLQMVDAQRAARPLRGTSALAPLALILVPTRELAVQVGNVCVQIARLLADHSKARPLKIRTVFGGVSINPQMMALRGGADLVVATTGRLLDLLGCNALHLGHVQTVVLDEADRMLDFGFDEELSQVLKLLPARRQSLLFSATLPDAVQGVANRMLHRPERITIEAGPLTTPRIHQRAIAVDPSKRTQLLRHLVQSQGLKRVLVFVATKYAAHTVAEKLRKAQVAAAPFHGDLAQSVRSQVLEDFKRGAWDVLVTTDLAARGIDVTALSLVVNHDLPRSADDYTHRIGRTARAGTSGMAISFVSAATEAHLQLIEKRHGMHLVREQIAGFEPLEPTQTKPQAFGTVGLDPMGGIKGKRPSKKDKLRALLAQA